MLVPLHRVSLGNTDILGDGKDHHNIIKLGSCCDTPSAINKIQVRKYILKYCCMHQAEISWDSEMRFLLSCEIPFKICLFLSDFLFSIRAFRK